ncbi:MAG TPA: hypothetical protein VL360_04615 [Gammaproteobacteria bacterium]|jgi:hypothetical protein|nr:hypothetical protein [Gammaproteobacteria bacterium]
MITARDSSSVGTQKNSELQDTVTSGNLLYQNISSDGEAPAYREQTVADFINIRPTADIPQTSMTPLQIILKTLRFGLGCCTAFKSSDFSPLTPINTMYIWSRGILNIEAGRHSYNAVRQYWLDTWEAYSNDGFGNPALGLVISSIKVAAAILPSALVGLGLGTLINYYREEIKGNSVLSFLTQPTMARIMTGLISPWLYFGMRKLIDHFFPPHNQQANSNAPIHPVQTAILAAFSVYDALIIYDFIRILVQTWAPESVFLVSPQTALLAIAIYLLLSNVIDPYVFGPSPLYGPPPFDVYVTNEEIGNIEKFQQLVSDNADIPDVDLFPNADIERKNVLQDKVKNGLFYAACASVAASVGVAANEVIYRLAGDKMNASEAARTIGTAATVAATAATQIALDNAGPWIINKTKSCWANLFNQNIQPKRPPPPTYLPAAPIHR